MSLLLPPSLKVANLRQAFLSWGLALRPRWAKSMRVTLILWPSLACINHGQECEPQPLLEVVTLAKIPVVLVSIKCSDAWHSCLIHGVTATKHKQSCTLFCNKRNNKKTYGALLVWTV